MFHVESGYKFGCEGNIIDYLCAWNRYTFPLLFTYVPFTVFTHWTSKGADTDFLSKADKGKNLYALTSSLSAVVTSENPLYVSTMTLARRSGIGGRSAIK